MKNGIGKMLRAWVPFISLSVIGTVAACASWNPGASSEPSVPQSSLSPEESSERIDKILEEKKAESQGDTSKIEEFDSAELCVQDVLRGLLQCHVILLDAIDSGDLESMPDCDAFFQSGIEHVAADADAAAPGLGAAMVELRSTADFEKADLGGSSRPLACMASAVLWRSLFQPENLDAARGVPVALKIIEGTSPDHANALFGLPLWSRAVFMSQAPSEFGGRLEQAAKDLDASESMAGPLLPYMHALRGRYLCTARQDAQCMERAEAAFRSTPANPEVYQAANRLVQWVRARYNLLFPTGPLLKTPVELERSGSPEGSNG